MGATKKLSKAYLSNLHVNLILGDYIECDDRWREERHPIDYNKFYYICEGDGWVQTGEKSFFPKKGDLVLIPANKDHAYAPINDHYYKKYWCHFTATIGHKNLFEVFDFPNIVKVEDNHQWLVQSFQQLIDYERQDDIASILKAKAVLLEIIGYFLEKTKAKELSIYQSPSIEKLELLLAYIDNNLDQPITVEQLADVVHLQVNYFIKFFRSHLGSTPMTYVKGQRLEKAKAYLTASDLSISQIGQQVGYMDVSYFSSQFKSYTGMTPSFFRKKRGG